MNTLLVAGRPSSPVSEAQTEVRWSPLIDSFVMIRGLEADGVFDGTRTVELVHDELQQAVQLGPGLQHHQVGLVGTLDSVQHDADEMDLVTVLILL